jgi:hypothetical protein
MNCRLAVQLLGVALRGPEEDDSQRSPETMTDALTFDIVTHTKYCLESRSSVCIHSSSRPYRDVFNFARKGMISSQ